MPTREEVVAAIAEQTGEMLTPPIKKAASKTWSGPQRSLKKLEISGRHWQQSFSKEAKRATAQPYAQEYKMS